MKKTERQMWVCPDCGSIHVQQTNAVINLNDSSIVWDERVGMEEYFCLDCDEPKKQLTLKVIKTVNGAVRVEGYQVEDEDMEIHPAMDASFCLYSLEQANEMLLDGSVPGNWYLKAYYKGDVEEPTLMFKGKNPRITS